MYKKYDKIKNKGFRLADFLETGFSISEKLDGANASFTYDRANNKMRAFSRNQELSEGNTLNGFYQFVQELFKEFDDSQLELLEGRTIFGEWMTKHKVPYKDEVYKRFFAFDTFNLKTERYEDYYTRTQIFVRLQLDVAPVVKLITPQQIKEGLAEEIQALVGKSNLTMKPDTGEGIVIKSLEGRSVTEESYKFVTDAFRESKRLKKAKPVQGAEHIVDYAITSNRLEKLIYKKMDEGVLEESDLTLQQFGKVMGAVAKDFQEDILEEEMDVLVKQIRQRIGKQLPNVLRPFLEERDMADSDI